MSARTATSRVAVVAPSVSMACSDMSARTAGRRVAVVALQRTRCSKSKGRNKDTVEVGLLSLVLGGKHGSIVFGWKHGRLSAAKHAHSARLTDALQQK